MELEFTDEQQELRSTVRTFLERECPMALVRSVVEKGVPAEDLWAHMVGLGWPALTVPEEFGGVGLGFVELAVVAEELGRVVAPGPFLGTVTQFVPAVRHAGTPEQQERFLGSVAAGEITGTLAVGGNVTAEPVSSGWSITGTVRHVVDGDRADEVAIAARVDDGWGLFVVPAASVRATPEPVLDKSRPLATVEVECAVVDGERALGVPGGAETALDRAVEESIAALALEMVGTCQAIFDVAIDYARERHQFGVPIGSFQAVKHKFANMLVSLERARATAYYAAATVAEEDERRPLAVAMAKAAAGDAQRLIAEEGIQTMGGIGYTWEHDMHLYVKRAKSGDALLGTSSHHRARVARLLGL
jgi:alkylation response protein AidB-like acyl-CoA dehydrogenase